jgi:multiple sugar transport system permease protein
MILIIGFPLIFGFLLFYVLPFIASGYYAMAENTMTMKFVWFDNYIAILKNQFFLLALKNTALFTAIAAPLLVIFALLLAILLTPLISRIKFISGAFLMPLLMPSATLILFWSALFSPNTGLNSFFGRFGESFALLAPVYTFFLWKNIGIIAFILISGLVKIPKELYEAATTDGAGSVRKHLYITLPLLLPSLFFAFLFGIVLSFKVYKEVYLLYGSYPHDALYSIQHYINNKFLKLDYVELSAAAIIFAVCILAFIAFLLGLKKLLNKVVI